MSISRKEYLTLINAMSDACKQLSYTTDVLNEALDYLKKEQLKAQSIAIIDCKEVIVEDNT